MKYYSRDPRWIRARFNSTCRCGWPIKAGDEILYWPYNRSVQCSTCGEPAWQQFLSEAADEDTFNGCGNPYAS
jgi:hypothetical protein